MSVSNDYKYEHWNCGYYSYLFRSLMGVVAVLVIGLLVWLSSKKNKQSQLKKCPFCAEEIKSEAKVCRFCNREV